MSHDSAFTEGEITVKPEPDGRYTIVWEGGKVTIPLGRILEHVPPEVRRNHTLHSPGRAEVREHLESARAAGHHKVARFHIDKALALLPPADEVAEEESTPPLHDAPPSAAELELLAALENTLAAAEACDGADDSPFSDVYTHAHAVISGWYKADSVDEGEGG